MQNNKQTATDLLSYLDTTEPSPPTDVRNDLQELASFDIEQVDNEEKRTAYAELCARLASALNRYFDDHESTYIDQSSKRALARARHQLQLLEQASCQYSVTGEEKSVEEGMRIRDQAMAENIAWLVEHESASLAAVWAHNAHIKRGAISGGQYGDAAAMGDALAEHETIDYAPLGFSIATGEVRSFSFETDQYASYSVREPPKGSLPAVLAETDTEVGYLDLTQFPDGEVTDWFASEPPRYAITGAAIDGDPVEFVESNPQTDFDGIIFIQESNPARGLGT